jgi:hypothetical protein
MPRQTEIHRGSDVAGGMTILVRHKLRPGPYKSLCAPNIVGPILSRFRFLCFFPIPEIFVAHYIGLFYFGP